MAVVTSELNMSFSGTLKTHFCLLAYVIFKSYIIQPSLIERAKNSSQYCSKTFINDIFAAYQIFANKRRPQEIGANNNSLFAIGTVEESYILSIFHKNKNAVCI